MTTRDAYDTFPCGRNVNVWESCKDCPDYPCEECDKMNNQKEEERGKIHEKRNSK